MNKHFSKKYWDKSSIINPYSRILSGYTEKNYGNYNNVLGLTIRKALNG